ncbi:MAG: 5'/3'-nucleotidase SurE [Elusimicrobiota bacterium]|nr:5'/3'-nucleotidase SurE [Elusimicrobiota bacterium]
MKKIVITNDDGIFGVGLAPLAKELSQLGKIVVIVPDKERSAVSHSLTLHKPIKVKKIDNRYIFDDKDRIQTYIVDGTPADCVRFGFISICKYKLDLVVSGINFGPNLGNDVIYSGTVAAAREGAILGIPSIAVSLVSKSGKNFQTAAKIAYKIAKMIFDRDFLGKITNTSFLNVNVPDLPLKKVSCIRITSLGERFYDETIQTRKDPYGLPYHWLKGKFLGGKNLLGTDIWSVNNNYVSITPLKINATDFMAIEKLKKVKFEL